MFTMLDIKIKCLKYSFKNKNNKPFTCWISQHSTEKTRPIGCVYRCKEIYHEQLVHIHFWLESEQHAGAKC